MHPLQAQIEHLYSVDALTGSVADHARQTFQQFREALTRGEIRAAEKNNGRWQVNAWVKQGILLGFKLGELAEMDNGVLSFV
ncbi:MAG TPA: 2,3,4,5-tetrahydropyridine-2,6-dicarboxylate N-succinyltransferase, partial [Candidatus Angelobacter sp.]|nr:2,3,4,5-tetrahydropyridine-2,6-dicarboxylate N-succinyltransferase [Candidatus Angelobacter sp.]